MATHVVVELEEGTLNVVVGRRESGVTRVTRSLRLPLPDLGHESLAAALRAIDGDLLVEAAGVHVVLGDRRAQHFLSTVPRMAARDATAFVTREAVRLTNMQAPADVLLATRLVRRLPGGKLVLATSAVPNNAWRPLQQAFEDVGIPVLSLQTMESCLALATVAAINEPVAVLECNAGRARFVLCVDQTPIQVRRFLVGGGGETNSGALVTQLMMELPRTFDWLRETGQPVPDWLVLGSRVPVDEESLDMLCGDDLEQISRALLPVEVDENQAAPSLGVATLIERICAGSKAPSLLDPPQLQLPWGTGRLVAVAAAVVVGVVCSYSAVVDGGAWLRQVQQRRATAQELAALEAEIMGAAAEAQVTGDAQLMAALSMRRPISLLVSDVSNCGDDQLNLEQLEFASTERVVVSGQVHGADRRDALAAMSRFAQRLRRLPYLLADGHEEIGEVAGQWNRLRFKLSLSWRNE